MYRRLTAAVVGLAAVVVGATVVASPAQADVAPPGTVWYEGMLRSWANGGCLDSNDASEIYTVTCNGQWYQKWRITIVYWYEGEWPGVTIQDVANGKYLSQGYQLNSTDFTIRVSDDRGLWTLFMPYSGRFDVYRFGTNGTNSRCIDANLFTDTTGQRPYLHWPCNSNYQDWKTGY
jgi:hypothetical protein